MMTGTLRSQIAEITKAFAAPAPIFNIRPSYHKNELEIRRSAQSAIYRGEWSLLSTLVYSRVHLRYNSDTRSNEVDFDISDIERTAIDWASNSLRTLVESHHRDKNSTLTSWVRNNLRRQSAFPAMGEEVWKIFTYAYAMPPIPINYNPNYAPTPELVAGRLPQALLLLKALQNKYTPLGLADVTDRSQGVYSRRRRRRRR